MAQCRSHRGCMVYLTQSLHSYYSALKGESGRHQADALLSNFHHKLFHALGDVQTAEWASSLIGKSLQTFVGGSSHDEGDMFDTMFGRTNYSGNFSEHYEQILQNNAFLSGLRTGEPVPCRCHPDSLRRAVFQRRQLSAVHLQPERIRPCPTPNKSSRCRMSERGSTSSGTSSAVTRRRSCHLSARTSERHFSVLMRSLPYSS
jgi:hypothetical protein